MTSLLFAMAVGGIGAPVILKASPPILPTHYERSVKITTSRLPTQPILTGKLVVPRGFLKVTVTGQGFDKNGARVAMPPVRFSIFNPNSLKSASHTFTPENSVATFRVFSSINESDIAAALRPEDPARLKPIEIKLLLDAGAQSGFIGKLELDGPAPYRAIPAAAPPPSPFVRLAEARMTSGKTYIAVFGGFESRPATPGSLSTFTTPTMVLEMTGKSVGLPFQTNIKLGKPFAFIVSGAATIAGGAANLSVKATAKRRMEGSELTTSLQIREYSGGYTVQWNDPTIVR